MSDLSIATRQSGDIPSVSFEFFPPKNDPKDELYNALDFVHVGFFCFVLVASTIAP